MWLARKEKVSPGGGGGARLLKDQVGFASKELDSDPAAWIKHELCKEKMQHHHGNEYGKVRLWGPFETCSVPCRQ